MNEERIYNQTFKGGTRRLARFNACVGNNGQPDMEEYASGFFDAALFLSEAVIKDSRKYPVDLIIYPIAFNMRHGVELWLKHFLKQIKHIRSQKISKLTKDLQIQGFVTEVDMTKTHDINVFWRWFKFNSEKKDYRFKEMNHKLSEYISDIGEIDPTGQTFRYPFDTESLKHLVNTPIINIVNLNKRLVNLKGLIRELERLLSDLIEEYGTGTYTNNLAREQLHYISKKLPNRKNWSSVEFKETKDRLKSELRIGSKEYSEALNIIQNNYEFAANVGVIIPLKSLSKEELTLFIKTWLVFHPESVRDSNPFEAALNFEQIEYEQNSLAKAVEEISIGSQADIGALFYLAIEPEYSENYHQKFEIEYVDASREKSDDSSALKYLNHFAEKANYIENMVISLKLLRQTELLSDLQKQFDVVDREVKKAYTQ